MSYKKMFASMDIDTRRFYSRIINTALFNIYAVRHGLFGELLCESPDPEILQRWEQAQSTILEGIKVKLTGDPNDAEQWEDS